MLVGDQWQEHAEKTAMCLGYTRPSICGWRQSKISVETDGNSGEAAAQKAHHHLTLMSSKVLLIQIAWSTCRHPWANSHCISYLQNGNEKKTAIAYRLGEVTSILKSISLWEVTSSYARNRYGATKEKDRKGLVSNPPLWTCLSDFLCCTQPARSWHWNQILA